MNREELIAEIQNQRNMMVAVAAGGPEIDTVNNEYARRRRYIAAELDELGLDDPNPHSDLWGWYGKWSADLPTYQSRRTYLLEMYAPLLDQFSNRSRAGAPPPSATLLFATNRPRRSCAPLRSFLDGAIPKTDPRGVVLTNPACLRAFPPSRRIPSRCRPYSRHSESHLCAHCRLLLRLEHPSAR